MISACPLNCHRCYFADGQTRCYDDLCEDGYTVHAVDIGNQCEGQNNQQVVSY